MAKQKVQTKTIGALDPAAGAGKLKPVGGSGSDDFNHILANHAVRSLWIAHSDETAKDQQIQAVLSGMIGIGPRDELEGMLAAQKIAAHSASMECFRRAMIDEQTFEGRRENLNQANKLSRTHTSLLEALNRHRGKGQQPVAAGHPAAFSSPTVSISLYFSAKASGDRVETAKSE